MHRPDSRIHKALAHPLRLEILAALGEPGAVLAPSELARRIDLPVQKLNYHFTVLAEAKMIELAGTEPVRGAVKHFYRASRNAPTASSLTLPVPQQGPAKSAVAAKSLSAYFEAATEAVVAGAFERHDGARFSWGKIELDAEGMAEMSGLLAGLLDRLTKLEEECAGRIEAGEAPIEAIYAIGGFESPSAQRSARDGREP